jgi:hypothetical protein
MHQGIGDNRNMITADREAASSTRLAVSQLRREVTEISEHIENNNTAISERFIVVETANATTQSNLAAITKNLTEAYKTVYDE